MTMFVERDQDGAIKGTYACLQPSYAEEELDEDDPEIMAFLSPARPILVPYGVFRARWQPAELEALLAVKNPDWRVEAYVTLASAQGHVNLFGETAGQAKALFVALGVLTAERADAIFAAA